ncbi:hypothetical protein ACN38_g12553 [Penicillium nordicum]|uniref:Uncharacterized protein n=1 Tax=Penicillium nordicum TaxID=229535 RepID=A0A0M8NYB8_9EURO|nr:hypothetical protein ACN38_g12553 [Penicillium nordicum]
MLQEGSNELAGEVITNERVMCRMAYLVARTQGTGHPHHSRISMFICSDPASLSVSADFSLECDGENAAALLNIHTRRLNIHTRRLNGCSR